MKKNIKMNEGERVSGETGWSRPKFQKKSIFFNTDFRVNVLTRISVTEPFEMVMWLHVFLL